MKKTIFALIMSFTALFAYAQVAKATCPPSTAGSLTLSNGDNCSISGVSGLMGTLGVPTGSSVTLNNGGELHATSISLSGGSISIQAGGSLKPGAGQTLYVTDADTDGYPATTTLYTSAAAGRRAINLMTSLTTTDCYDSNANAKPGQAAYFTTNRGDGSYDYNCVNGDEKQNATYTPGACGNCGGYTTDNQWTNPGDLATPACGGSYNKVDLNGSYVGNTCYAGTSCATLTTTNTYYTACH